ncbi:MAG: hypothetical protein ABI779_27170 [Acidobacteriota bacterium]
MRRSIIIVFLFLTVAAVAQDPNQARGFVPGRMYDFLGLDSVNTFNGNLNVRIPLGPVYSVRPGFDYQFVLAYNSKVWDFYYIDGAPPEASRRAAPEIRSNAGLGWHLTLGELLPPTAMSGAPHGWVYVGPDGGEHAFDSGASDPVETQTSDGSYLRMRRVPADTGLALQYREIDFPDGLVRRFDSTNQLVEIRDRTGNPQQPEAGNWVRIRRPSSTQWMVEDGYRQTVTRAHTITFAQTGNVRDNFKLLPIKLDLAAFGSGRAIYDLNYLTVDLPRGWCGEPIDYAPQSYQVPLLEEIKFPDGSTFDPSYQMTETSVCTTGTMRQLTLPTGGSIQWEHGLYQMPNQECVEPGDQSPGGWVNSYAGVISRTLKGSDGNVVEKRTYSPTLVLRLAQTQRCGTTNYSSIRLPPEEFRSTVTVTVPENGVDQTLDRTTYHFSVFPAGASQDLATYGKSVEYGLPFVRRESRAERWLSSETELCSGGTCATGSCQSGSCPQEVARASFLSYGYGYLDDGSLVRASNPRVEAQRTLFNRDRSCGVTQNPSEVCYTDSAQSEFDGYGHYRQNVLTSNFASNPPLIMTSPVRTVRTEYAPDPVNWLLNLYTASSVTEDGVVKRTATTFDALGLLKSQRVLKSAAPGMGDLLAVTCRDSRAFVAAEKWLGGDDRTPPADNTDLCSAVPAAKEYEVQHEYPVGDAFRGWHKAHYRGFSFNLADESFDSNTGNASSVRDSAGLSTSYTYDAMGRISSITPPGAATTQLSYTNATLFAPARATSTTTGTSSSLVQTYDYDGLGRLLREKRRTPDGGWALRTNAYKGSALRFTSEWVSFSPTADEWLVTPTLGTKFEYDQFGRATKTTSTDDKVFSTVYTGEGVREVLKKRAIAMSAGGADTEVTVTERYDGQGNLVQVNEPSGPTAGTGLLANVTTSYRYDAGGHLTGVTMTPPSGAPQLRTFGYDSRGLLVSETHPEKAQVSYGGYDSRGHPWTTLDGDVGLKFSYDGAERLERISDSADAPLKEFMFAPSNATGDYRMGKLWMAIRHNVLPGGGDFRVTETYKYGTNGRPSERVTQMDRVGTTSYSMQRFKQTFSYDEFGQVSQTAYPTCELNNCVTTGSLGTVANTRTAGLLTAIPGFGSFTYHPSGMVASVRHETSPARDDVYEADQLMARPSRISFQGTTSCTPPAVPVIAASSSVCGGSSGNQASVSTPQSGVSYQWTIQNGSLSTSSGSSVLYTAGSSGQVVLNVTAQNACSSTAGTAKNVTIGQPTATLSGDATINAGASAVLTVALSGTAPWTIGWSDGQASTVSSQTGTYQRTVQPAQTTTYTLTSVSDATNCTVVKTGSARIVVRPAAPAWLTAQATDLAVRIDWPAVTVSGGARYDVERATNINGPYQRIATAITALLWNDSAPPQAGGLPKAYVYRVLTVAPDDTRSPSELSPRDYAVTAPAVYPTGPVMAGLTSVKAEHIAELRRSIDALRSLVGLGAAFAGQAAPTGLIRASDFTALLAPLDAARAPFGAGAFVYANGILRPAATGLISAEHVNQLREVMR